MGGISLIVGLIWLGLELLLHCLEINLWKSPDCQLTANQGWAEPCCWDESLDYEVFALVILDDVVQYPIGKEYEPSRIVVGISWRLDNCYWKYFRILSLRLPQIDAVVEIV